MTRAKFKCTSYSVSEYGIEYRFSPVTASEIPEDQHFWKYTPVGQLTMTVTNQNVKFDMGHFYYLDFTPVLEGTTS